MGWERFGARGRNQAPKSGIAPPKLDSLSTGGPLPQASPVSVYLFPGERSGAQPHSPPVVTPTGSLGSCSEAKEDAKEEEGDGDTLDSDEFCILDAPGLGIPVCWWGRLGGARNWWERVAPFSVLLELPGRLGLWQGWGRWGGGGLWLWALKDFSRGRKNGIQDRGMGHRTSRRGRAISKKGVENHLAAKVRICWPPGANVNVMCKQDPGPRETGLARTRGT